jgi:hypothetical protein
MAVGCATILFSLAASAVFRKGCPSLFRPVPGIEIRVTHFEKIQLPAARVLLTGTTRPVPERLTHTAP